MNTVASLMERARLLEQQGLLHSAHRLYTRAARLATRLKQSPLAAKAGAEHIRKELRR